MSWNDIAASIAGKAGNVILVSKADGTVWGNNNVAISADEIKTFVNFFSSGSNTGFHINGVKYMCIRADQEDGITLKKGADCAFAYKTNQCILIAVADASHPLNEVSAAVIKLAEELKTKGF